MQEQRLTHTQDDTELQEHKGYVVITELHTFITHGDTKLYTYTCTFPTWHRHGSPHVEAVPPQCQVIREKVQKSALLSFHSILP